MSFTRMLSLFLAVILCAASLTACSQSFAQPSADDGELPVESEEERYVEENGYELDVVDYDGATCCFCTASSLNVEEETGESLNDAVYRRNEKVKSLYNVDLSSPDLPFDYNYNDWTTYVRRVIMSGDDAYQVISNGSHVMAAESLTKNQYQNLLNFDAFDFSQPWWTAEFQKAANLGGALYETVGHVDASFYNMTCAILFNKELAKDLHVEDLYQLVRDGKWTLDKLKEYTALAALDLDGNGQMDQDVDRFGLVCNRNNPLDAFVTAFHVIFTDFDEDGLPHLRDLPEYYVEIQETMMRFIVKDPEVLYAYDPGTMEFMEGRALFEAAFLSRAVEYRAMENDFGILPYPMWNEEQGQYYTHNEFGSGYSIPVTTQGDMPAHILEALAYFGYKMVKPAYYDKTLKGKAVRDEESIEMLDLMFDHITYDFVEVYSHFFGTPSPDLLLRTSLFEGRSMAVEWAKKKGIYAKKMKELLSILS